jgi:DNA-binding SARP family transcriptional activator
LEKAASIAQCHGLRNALREILLHKITVECRARGWGVAGQTLASVDALSLSSRPMNESLYWLHHSRFARHSGERALALDTAMLAYQAAVRSKSKLWEMIIGICIADALIDVGRFGESRPLLERSRELIDRAGVYDCYRAVLQMAEAWSAFMSGDKSTATEHLRRALAQAHEGNRRYYLCFLYCGLPQLLKFALEQRLETDLCRQLAQMFRFKPPKDAPENWPWPVRILTLGRFEVRIDDQPMEFSRKLPRKTLLLLKAIIAQGGRNVPEQALCDALWGDEDGDAAASALAVTIVRLRRLLGTNDVIAQQAGRISLNPELCWVDAWAFERQVAENAQISDVLKIYAGVFLPDEEGEPWSVALRERLRGKFIDALFRHGAALEQQDELQGALQCYQRGIDADPIVETFHHGLMRCYERMGRRTEALSAYRRFKQTLSVVLGVPPSESTQQLFKDMLQRQVSDGASTDVESRGAGGAVTDARDRSGSGNVVRRLTVPRKQVR